MGEPLRVLLVEDSESDAILLQEELRRGGMISSPSAWRTRTRFALPWHTSRGT